MKAFRSEYIDVEQIQYKSENLEGYPLSLHKAANSAAKQFRKIDAPLKNLLERHEDLEVREIFYMYADMIFSRIKSDYKLSDFGINGSATILADNWLECHEFITSWIDARVRKNDKYDTPKGGGHVSQNFQTKQSQVRIKPSYVSKLK